MTAALIVGILAYCLGYHDREAERTARVRRRRIGS